MISQAYINTLSASLLFTLVIVFIISVFELSHIVNNIFIVGDYRTKTLKLLWRYRQVKIKNTSDYECKFSLDMSSGAKTITLSTQLTKEARITALLHEIGHMVDMTINYNLNLTEKQMEKRAWKIAIDISKEYRIPLEKEVAIGWLGTYKARSRHLEKYNQASV